MSVRQIVFLNNFGSAEDIAKEYQGDSSDDLDGVDILVAWYGYGDYSGSSFVLYRKGGKLYEVNGSHCSCNGLEGQWAPEETTWEILAVRDWWNAYDCGFEGEQERNRLMRELIIENIGSDRFEEIRRARQTA